MTQTSTQERLYTTVEFDRWWEAQGRTTALHNMLDPASAKLLAWGPHEAFHRYRQTDDRGHQRASRTLRDAIVAACRGCTTIVDGLCSRGFTCDEQASPKRLRRFEHPFTPTTQGLDRPEFEKDQPW